MTQEELNQLLTTNTPTTNVAPQEPLDFNKLLSSDAPVGQLIGTEKFIKRDIYNPNLTNAVRPIAFNDIYAYTGPNSGFFRKYPTFTPGENNEVISAANQSGWELTGNTLMTFGTLMGSTIANYFGSTAANIGKIASGDYENFFDSELTEFAAGVTEGVQWKYPIYSTAEMQQYEANNVGAGASIGKFIPGISPNFGRYSARLLGQLGFSAGTVVTAIGEEIALAALTAEAGGAGAIVNAPRQLYKVFRSFSQVLKNADRLSDLYKTTNTLEKVGKSGVFLLREANRATGEARLEALMASEAFKVKELQALEEKGIFPTAEQLLQIELQSEKVGNATFNWNMPILMASNIIMLNNIIKPKSLSTGKLTSEASKVAFKDGVWSTNKELIKNGFLKSVDPAWNWLKKAPAVTFSEGIEEVAQGIGSRAAEQYYSLQNTDAGKSNTNFIQSLGTEFSRSFSTGEGWDEFVSGALTGLLIGSGPNAMKVREEYRGATEVRDLLNTTANDLVNSINYKNLTEQVNMAGKSANELEKGNVKAAKDIRNQAMVGFFQVARRTGKDKEAITELIGYLNNAKDENRLAVEEITKDKTIEEYQAELNKKYDEYTKIADMSENLFSKELTSGTKIDQGVAEFVKNQYVTALMGSSDARERVASISRDLNTLTQNSKNSSKINELTRNVFDSEELARVIGQVSSSIETTEDFLTNVKITKEERYAKNQELEANRKHLANLQLVNDALYGTKEKYSPAQASKRIVEAIKNYDSNVNVEEVQKLVDDMVQLETENEQLTFFANYLHNPQFRSKFYNAAKDMQDKYNKTPKETSAQETAPTSPEQVNETLTNSGLTKDSVDTAVTELNKITENDGVFEYAGNSYDTIEEAREAVVENLPVSDRASARTVLPSLVQQAEAQNAPQEIERVSTEPVTQAEYDKFKETNTIPEDVRTKLFNIDGALTTQEQEMFDFLLEEDKSTQTVTNTEKVLTPKTMADVRKDPLGWGAGSDSGILTNYYNVVVGRIYDSLPFALKILGLKTLLKDFKGITISTINLNDNVIKDNVNTIEKVTVEQIRTDIDDRGYSVIKDNKGRLIIVSRGNRLEAKNLISKPVAEGGLGLYMNPSAYGRFTEVRQGGPKGKTIASSFGEESFNVESSRAIATVRKGDKIQVFIPNNKFNQDLLKTFRKAKDVEKAFAKLKESLVIELRKNGATIGVMRAGDYFNEDSKMSPKVKSFRDKAVTTALLTQLGQEDIMIGTVGVSSIVAQHTVNVNDNGDYVFTTLSDYEQSQKRNKDIKITYFVGNTTETAIDKNGKEISRSSVGRVKSFIPNAIYVQIKNTKTGEEALLQAVAEEALTFSQEDLKNNDFKQQLSINLQPSESPLISKRVAIDENTFSSSTREETNKAELRQELETALSESQNLTLDLGGVQLPLTNVEADYDLQIVTGVDPNGNNQVLSFLNITGVSEYIDVPQETTTTNEVVNEETTNEVVTDPTTTTEPLEESIPELNTEQKEDWIKENGEVGKTYTLEDGTTLVIQRKDENGTVITKGGFLIRFKPDGSEESIDILKTLEEIENTTFSEENLYNIWISQKEGLSLRDEMILVVNSERIAKFKKTQEQVIKDLQNGYDNYLPIGLKDLLTALNVRPNELMLVLSLTNLDLVQKGIEVTSLEQLMTEAQVPTEVSESIQEVLSFGSYIALFNLVTSGIQVNVSNRKYEQGVQLMMEFADTNAENAINVEISQQDEELMEATNKFAKGFKSLMGKQGLFVKGLNTLSELASDQIKSVATAVKNFVLTSNYDQGDNFIKAFVTLNQALRPHGLEVNLENLIKVEPKGMFDVGVDFIQINDTKNFLKEFDDILMQKENQERITNGKNTILIKRDNGGLFELPIRQISTVMNENEQNDSVYLNDILEPVGVSIEDIYVIANHTVNGNATSLIERSIRRVNQETLEARESFVVNREPTINGSSQEEYFNKSKVEKEVKTKTCS